MNRRPNYKKIIFIAATLFTMNALFTNCSPMKAVGVASVEGSAKGNSVAGQKAFADGLYAFAQTQNCVKCHGSAIHPNFASPNFALAYAEARAYIDFNNPDISHLAINAGNGHCADVPCSDPDNTPRVRTMLEAWAAAELADQAGAADATANVRFVTTSLAIPANLPKLGTVAKPAVMRFSGSSLNPGVPALQNALIEIEIQLANDTTYRISRLKIMGNTSVVTVSGVYVFIKEANASGLGTQDAVQGVAWNSQVNLIAPISTLPSILPATPLTATVLTSGSLNGPVQSTSDVITLGFADLR